MKINKTLIAILGFALLIQSTFCNKTFLSSQDDTLSKFYNICNIFKHYNFITFNKNQ